MSTGKATIRAGSEAQRQERMRILTTAERKAAPSKAEQARRAAEAKAAIAQREFEKKIEAAQKKGRQIDLSLRRLQPTIGPVAPTTAQQSIFVRGGPAVAQATSNRYQQRALSSIVQRANQQGITAAKDVQISGLSQAAFKATQKFAKTTRKGAPILQEKISVVSPTTGKVLRYPIESVVRGAEMAGMIPGGLEVMARRPGVIVPALVVGARQATVGTAEAAIADPKQFVSDIATLGILFKGAGKIKVPKPKTTIPKVKAPKIKPVKQQEGIVTFKSSAEAVKKVRALQSAMRAEARTQRPIRPTLKEQQAMRRIERIRGEEDIKRSLTQRELIEQERMITREIRSLEAEAVKTKKILKYEQVKDQPNILSQMFASESAELQLVFRKPTSQIVKTKPIAKRFIAKKNSATKLVDKKRKGTITKAERKTLLSIKRELAAAGIIITIAPTPTLTKEIVTPKTVQPTVQKFEAGVKEIVAVKSIFDVARPAITKSVSKTTTKRKPTPKPTKVKEMMPLPIIPKVRRVEKKKTVKVARKVTKEYTNFQIVNQMAGINQLFG